MSTTLPAGSKNVHDPRDPYRSRPLVAQAKRDARWVALMGAVVGAGATVGLLLMKPWIVGPTGDGTGIMSWAFWACVLGTAVTVLITYIIQVKRIVADATMEEKQRYEGRRPLREKAKRFAVELRGRYRFFEELPEKEQREWGLRFYEDLMSNDAEDTRTFAELSAADDFPAVIDDLGDQGRWLTSTWEKRGRLLSEVRRMKYDADRQPKAPPPKKESDIDRIRREFGVVETFAQLEQERKRMAERYPDLLEDINGLAEDIKYKLKQPGR